jgi:SAM-dependent methyltransferase
MSFNQEWEEQAENWIAWARSGKDAYTRYRDAFFELVPAPGGAALEVGCGEGRVARELAGRGHRVVAIDASPTLIRAAREADATVSYSVADAAALPFNDDSFDLVVAYNSLMDVQEMPAAVSEIGRVLAPNGCLCACITHPLADAGRFTERRGDAPFIIEGSYLQRRAVDETDDLDGHPMRFVGWSYPFEDYSRALERAGLVIEAIREPPVPAQEVERDPSERRWQRLPNFLMFRACHNALSKR